MNPKTTPILYRELLVPVRAQMESEFERRQMIGGLLDDLSQLFDQKSITQQSVADPTLASKMYALSQVQRSDLGISGFNPFQAIHGQGAPELTATVAPQHDEVTTDNETFATRLIRFVDQTESDTVEIFGLNIFVPDATSTDLDEGQHKIVLVDANANELEGRNPVNGQVPILIVRNTKTGDTNAYSVTISSNLSTSSPSHHPVEYDSDDQATILLPDNTIAKITKLTGDSLKEIAIELNGSIDALKAKDESTLSDLERSAANLTIGVSVFAG